LSPLNKKATARAGKAGGSEKSRGGAVTTTARNKWRTKSQLERQGGLRTIAEILIKGRETHHLPKKTSTGRLKCQKKKKKLCKTDHIQEWSQRHQLLNGKKSGGGQ